MSESYDPNQSSIMMQNSQIVLHHSQNSSQMGVRNPNYSNLMEVEPGVKSMDMRNNQMQQSFVQNTGSQLLGTHDLQQKEAKTQQQNHRKIINSNQGMNNTSGSTTSMPAHQKGKQQLNNLFSKGLSQLTSTPGT